jgi:hypothetical protein
MTYQIQTPPGTSDGLRAALQCGAEILSLTRDTLLALLDDLNGLRDERDALSLANTASTARPQAESPDEASLLRAEIDTLRAANASLTDEVRGGTTLRAAYVRAMDALDRCSIPREDQFGHVMSVDWRVLQLIERYTNAVREDAVACADRDREHEAWIVQQREVQDLRDRVRWHDEAIAQAYARTELQDPGEHTLVAYRLDTLIDEVLRARTSERLVRSVGETEAMANAYVEDELARVRQTLDLIQCDHISPLADRILAIAEDGKRAHGKADELQRYVDESDQRLNEIRKALTQAGVPEVVYPPEYSQPCGRALGQAERVQRLAKERDDLQRACTTLRDAAVKAGMEFMAERQRLHAACSREEARVAGGDHAPDRHQSFITRLRAVLRAAKVPEIITPTGATDDERALHELARVQRMVNERDSLHDTLGRVTDDLRRVKRDLANEEATNAHYRAQAAWHETVMKQHSARLRATNDARRVTQLECDDLRQQVQEALAALDRADVPTMRKADEATIAQRIDLLAQMRDGALASERANRGTSLPHVDDRDVFAQVRSLAFDAERAIARTPRGLQARMVFDTILRRWPAGVVRLTTEELEATTRAVCPGNVGFLPVIDGYRRIFVCAPLPDESVLLDLGWSRDIVSSDRHYYSQPAAMFYAQRVRATPEDS